MDGCPGPKRHLALGGLPAHQHPDSSTGQRRRSVTSMPSCITRQASPDDLKFQIQPHTRLPLDSLRGLSRSGPSTSSALACPRLTMKFAMLHRDLRISDASALQARRFDQSAGRIIRRILEHTAGTGQRQWLSVLAILQIVFHHLFDSPRRSRASTEATRPRRCRAAACARRY